MYIPSAFEITDPVKIAEAISSNSFACMVSQDGDLLFASHLPFLYKPELGEKGKLISHMARANRHWRLLGDGKETPAPNRKPILISADEQALMICNLVNGKLSFSKKTRTALKVIMTVKKTERGTIYGKTGTGEMDSDKYNVAWFVGYVEAAGKTFAFACVMKEPHLMGTDVRDIVEHILVEDNLL